MKLSCSIIEDMLPMYYDRVCSRESDALVEEHLHECSHCSNVLAALRTQMALPENPIDDLKPLKKIQKRFRRVHIRWLAAILTVLALVPVAFLGWNEHSAQGVSFTNQDELYTGNAFMTCLVDGDYAKAYSYLDVEAKKHQWLEDWFTEEELVNMEADGLRKFCELGQKLEAHGGMEAYEYVGTSASYGVDYRGNKVHQIIYRIRYAGEDQLLHLNVSSEGVSGILAGGSFLTDPLAQLGIWGEYLWQDYKGCYYDPDRKTYVYYEAQ